MIVLWLSELVLWQVSVPLVFVGAYYGFKKESIEAPCKVNQIPRQVPPQVWYQGALASVLMGGVSKSKREMEVGKNQRSDLVFLQVLPFGAIFIELFFILSSLWMHQFYYL